MYKYQNLNLHVLPNIVSFDGCNTAMVWIQCVNFLKAYKSSDFT